MGSRMLLVICTRGILHANEISAVAFVNMHVSARTHKHQRSLFYGSVHQPRNVFVVVGWWVAPELQSDVLTSAR